MRICVTILLCLLCSQTIGQDSSALLTSEVWSSYTSSLVATNFGTTQDVPAYDADCLANPNYKINSWFYEPLKGRHYLKIVETPNGKAFVHIGSGINCLRVGKLDYSTPVTTNTVTVSNEQEFIAAFNGLASNTTVIIQPGIYRIQQAKLTQHHLTGLQNVNIIGNGAIISGFKLDVNSSVESHKTQAFGLKGGVWKRMNPKHPSGPGANYSGSVNWTVETLAACPLLGFVVNANGSISHNATPVPDPNNPEINAPAGSFIKLSNELSPNLFKLTHCKNWNVQGLTIEGYNSIYPNYSAYGCAFELQGCENMRFTQCTFDRLGGAAISALNTATVCKLIWVDKCKFIDNNDEITYIGMRHSGPPRSSGLVYFNNTVNCSVSNCEFDGNFFPLLNINCVNTDYVGNTFKRNRNNCLSITGMTGFGVAMWNNTFHECGNVLPSNEELAQAGPSFWFNNKSTFGGWNGTAPTLQYKGMSGVIAEGNRLGGTSTFRLLGGMYLFDNDIHIEGISNSVDVITTCGLSLGNRAFSRLVVKNNKWKLTNTGTRTASVVRHYEESAKTDQLANNLKTIEWENNTLEWDRTDPKMVFFGQRYLTAQEFTDWLQSAK